MAFVPDTPSEFTVIPVVLDAVAAVVVFLSVGPVLADESKDPSPLNGLVRYGPVNPGGESCVCT